MELVEQYRRPPATLAVSIRSPWYISIALFMLAGSTIIIIAVIAAVHRELSNPFSMVSDFFGDDAKQAALARGFTCQDTGLHSYCVQPDADNLFSGLSMQMSGKIAHEISFYPRENTLTLGDLELLWGKPKIWLYCETVVVFWPARHIMSIITSPQIGRISYFLPVTSVSFTRSGLPYRVQLLMNDTLHSCGGVRDVTLGLHSGWRERKP